MKKFIKLLSVAVAVMLCLSAMPVFAQTTYESLYAQREENATAITADYTETIKFTADDVYEYDICGHSGDIRYAKWYKLAVTEGTVYELSAHGEKHQTDMMLTVATADTAAENYPYPDEDVLPHCGERILYKATATGEVYVAVARYDKYDEAPLLTEDCVFSVKALGAAAYYKDVIENAPAITLPYSETVEVDTLSTDEIDNIYYTAAVKLPAGTNEDGLFSLLAEVQGEAEYVGLVLYENGGSGYGYVYGDEGAGSAYVLHQTDDQSLWALVYSENPVTVTLTAKEVVESAYNFLNPENTPTDTADNLWNWDSDTNTLTLLDGFEAYATYTYNSAAGEGAIQLPAGSTLVVEGKATVGAQYYAIYVDGALDIKLKEGAELTLMAENAGIYGYNDNTIDADISIVGEGEAKPELNIFGNYGNINIDAQAEELGITFKNVSTVLKGANGYGIDFYGSCGDVTFEDCDITFIAEYGIYAPGKNIKFDNCYADIDLVDTLAGVYEGADLIYSNISIENSAVNIYSKYDTALQGQTIDIKNSKFYIAGSWGSVWVPETADFTCDVPFEYYFDLMDLVPDGTAKSDDENLTTGYYCLALLVDTDDMRGFYAISSNEDADGVKASLDKKEYGKGATAQLTAQSDEVENPVNGDTKYRPSSWSVKGTELTGNLLGRAGPQVDISSLAAGDYTLTVSFTQMQYNNGVWEAMTAGSEKTVDIGFKVTEVKEDASQQTTSPKTGDTAIPMAIVLVALAAATYAYKKFTIHNA